MRLHNVQLVYGSPQHKTRCLQGRTENRTVEQELNNGVSQLLYTKFATLKLQEENKHLLALAMGIIQVSALMSREFKNNTLETLKASGVGYSNKTTKLSQQNKVILPICFIEHCPALSAGANEIQFQNPTGKKKITLAFTAPYLVIWKKLQKIVLKLLSELFNSSSTLIPNRNYCMYPFQ